MTFIFILQLILLLGLVGFFLAYYKAKSLALVTPIHSLPSYYAWHTAFWTIFPALLVLFGAGSVLVYIYVGQSNDMLSQQAEPGELELLLAQARMISGAIAQAIQDGTLVLHDTVVPQDVETVLRVLPDYGVLPPKNNAALLVETVLNYHVALRRGLVWVFVTAFFVAALGLFYGLRVVRPQYRARNKVENLILAVLVLASLVAILAAVAIIVSLFSNTVQFFRLYPAADFFFGLTWSPNFRGNSALGFLPLLWGTLSISLVALLVSVPLGLYTAIYLAEYAKPRFRGIVKPLLEILAGIPTIVYGLFALTIFGPMLMQLFGEGGALGVTWMRDTRSVLTAGIVMGVMLVPFVSSLADDIINAVPQALRDASYGLGATQSETVRQVVLPAALPGIVGAILLAASRAIGETMIVVMGAGAVALFSLNPLSAATTISAKIVSQLTGDSDFASPETLVAFALGLTLFFMTLALNVYALFIVRKYREQYE